MDLTKGSDISNISVQILVSTYNGEKYIEPLLKSLLAQDFPNVTILIRDDGSTDNTANIIERIAKDYKTIELIKGTNLGFPQSFFYLLECCSSDVDYLALCDHDDVWLPGKISRAIYHLSKYPSDIPTLYCSSLTMVDEDLKLIKPINVFNKELSFYNALVEASAWNCTSVINQTTRKMAINPMPTTVLFHDWWMYLIVSAFGQVIHDKESSILYRRHTNTFTKIPNNFFQWLQYRVNRYLEYGKLKPILRQAEEFYHFHGDLLKDKKKMELDNFLNSRKNLFTRLNYAVTCRLYRQNHLDSLIMRGLSIINRL
jgi:glycosyltransferase involved in cell wall biosynthesis